MKNTKKDILVALRLIFAPIARILLRAGVNWREFAEVAKLTFVDVASADFGIRGRPTNQARVAILTGFTRREVRRLRSMLVAADNAKPELVDRMNRATRVLTGWHNDAEFRGDDGKPKPLPPTDGDPSFEGLCKRYASDVPATTMLKELRHVGAVTEDKQGHLIARTRYYMPVQMDSEQILRSGSVLADIGDTVAYNLHRSSDQPTRFEGRATSTRIPKAAIPLFREYLEQEGQDFLERVDAWLAERELDNDGDEQGVRLGLGVYWIEK
jgi:hypothetical protein